MNLGAIVLAAFLGVLAAMLAPALSGSAPPAVAAGDCPAPIETAIVAATGEATGQSSGAGLACNPYIYSADGRWSSQADLNAKVLAVMNRCGNTTAGRYVVLALLESTGIPPQAGVPGFDNVCDQGIYSDWFDDVNSTSAGVDFTVYDGSTGSGDENVHGAVSGVMSVCGQRSVSHAIVSVIDRYPITDPDGINPNLHFQTGLVSRGQCDPSLYNNGAWASYADLKQRVIDRATSATVCANSEINAAYDALSNWAPLPEECDVSRYGNGSWANYQELVNRAYHSLRCENFWLGQAYAYGAPNRRIRGRGQARGECNGLLYTDGLQLFVSYPDTLSRVNATHSSFAQQGVSIDNGGDLTVDGTEFEAEKVLVGSEAAGGAPAGATLGGRVFTSLDGSPVRLISEAGGSVIGTGGLNVISTGGGNFVSNNNGNFVSNNNGNLIGQAGGNIISDNGGG